MDVPRALALVEEMQGKGIKLSLRARYSLRRAYTRPVGFNWYHKIIQVLRREEELRQPQEAPAE